MPPLQKLDPTTAPPDRARAAEKPGVGLLGS
jgi:hypothetical protein